MNPLTSTAGGAPYQDAAPGSDTSRFRSLTLFLAVFTFLTMAMGPLVRAEDAGLACPDWPLCFGYVLPPAEYRIWLEVGHRYLAMILGFIVLAWSIMIFARRDLRSRFAWYAVGVLLLLALQVFLGRQTVTQKLDPYIVKSHLINALFMFTVILAVWSRLRLAPDAEAQAKAAGAAPIPGRWFAFALLAFVFMQIYLGGRVSTNYAGMVCDKFPACNEVRVNSAPASDASTQPATRPVYFPPMKGNVEKHMTHRFMAYFLVVLAIALIPLSRRWKWSPGRAKNALVLSMLIFSQVVLGVLNVLMKLPVVITVMHSITAIVIYVFAFLLWYELKPEYGRTAST